MPEQHKSSCARMVDRVSPSCVNTVAKAEISSLLCVFAIAQAKEDINVTNSQEFIINHLYNIICKVRKRVRKIIDLFCIGGIFLQSCPYTILAIGFICQ